jgi:hypothetical protein
LVSTDDNHFAFRSKNFRIDGPDWRKTVCAWAQDAERPSQKKALERI